MSSRASSRCSSVSSSSSYSSKPSPSLGKSKNIRKSRGITKAKHSSSLSSSSSASSESVVKMLCIRLPTPPQSESSTESPLSSSSNSSQPRSQPPSQPPQPVVGTSFTSLLPSNHSTDSSSSSKIYWKRKNYLNSQQYIDSLQSLEFDHYHREQQPQEVQNDKQLISQNNLIIDDPNVVVSTENQRNETNNTNSNQIAKPCAIVARQIPSAFSGPNVQQSVSEPVTPPLESDIAWLLRQQTQLHLQAAMLDHLISANPLAPTSSGSDHLQPKPQQSLFYLERTWIDQRQLWLTSKFAAIFPNSGTNST